MLKLRSWIPYLLIFLLFLLFICIFFFPDNTIVKEQTVRAETGSFIDINLIPLEDPELETKLNNLLQKSLNINYLTVGQLEFYEIEDSPEGVIGVLPHDIIISTPSSNRAEHVKRASAIIKDIGNNDNIPTIYYVIRADEDPIFGGPWARYHAEQEWHKRNS